MDLTIARNGGRDRRHEGACADADLPSTDFWGLLGIELFARTPPGVALAIARDAFELLAKARNDLAAKDALSVVHKLTVLTDHCGVTPFLRATPSGE
ncbi:MAG: hypothetical protein KGH97_02745 [Patescibacteria group bacterium]|nr:hypothetical protein [Patescibacteria group bacterium]